MMVFKTVGLFAMTTVAEIVGCYLPCLWLRDRAGAWVLLPAAVSLAAFIWLLSLHPVAAGRTYAAYGSVYVVMALAWLWWWKVRGIDDRRLARAHTAPSSRPS